MATEEEQLVEALNSYAAKFDKLCQERHEAGAVEYGSFSFLGNDVLRMMIEELADTSNYCRMQAIKLLMLQDVLEENLSEEDALTANGQDINLGAQAFQGTKDVGWSRK